MSTQKRALAPTSSGQASLLKRPRVARTNQVWHQSERNHVPRSWLTEEDVRRVVREELERAKSHSAEYCQSCTGNALKDIVCSLENTVQRLEEAVEPANSHSPHLRRDNAKSMAKSDARNLQLQLRTKLSLPIYTGKKLEGKWGACISVALIDANTGYIVTSGPESSIKLDVVVLEGDFKKDDEDNWAQKEFENYVVKEREGKRPLLAGNLLVTLKGGVGVLGELIFTDNSSWNRSKMFRIGLKVASGYCGSTRIREAKTDAFTVKEHRGESYKKNYPPKSDDEVWRLEKIAKDGKIHKKLSEASIHKVEDFLLQLFTDSDKLREILGKSIIQKNWDSLVRHARTCKISWKLYLYYLDSMRKHGALFDADGQLIGLIKDRVYVATHRLSALEKEHGDTIIKKALDNLNDVREFNGEKFSGSMQIENLAPVRHNLAPQICATPGGPEAPLANVGLTAEGKGPCQLKHLKITKTSGKKN
ncbi:calmodulin-binding protein 60 D-like isoform X2 [Syzygium oleosum]|uniref:calmodulin-binding protein 60 D-like isoform X2 n=1 Tax=Syzygium oleosum TaxID=219896 RepID=UPI0024B9E683|nr:calmodulin-binding protein 60 D-like isoform X2 [Syzygium oleosum]